MKTITSQYKRFCYILFVVSTMLASCVNDVPYDAEVGASKLVLNALLLPDSTLTATVSRTVHFLDFEQPQRLADASVSALVNGTEHLLTYSSTTHDYRSECRLRAGDEVTLTASHALGTATASQMVSRSVPIRVVSTTKQPFVNPGDPVSLAMLNDVDSALLVRLHIDDPAGEANYYRLTIDYRGTYLASYPDELYGHSVSAGSLTNHRVTRQSFYPHYLFTESSSRLVTDSEVASQFLGGLLYLTSSNAILFSDEKLRNTSYGQPIVDFLMLLEMPRSTPDDVSGQPTDWGSYPDGDESFIFPSDTVSSATYHYHFMLETLSEDYYHYLTTVSSYEMNGNAMIAEPVRIHSNVSTGFGIVGSYGTVAIDDSVWAAF